MDDFEAYGQLRERALPRAPGAQPVPGSPGAKPAAGAPLAIATPARRRKRSHLIRNTFLVIVAYFVLAVGTTVQPLPVPFTSVHASVPFPGGAPLLFGLP